MVKSGKVGEESKLITLIVESTVKEGKEERILYLPCV